MHALATQHKTSSTTAENACAAEAAAADQHVCQRTVATPKQLAPAVKSPPLMCEKTSPHFAFALPRQGKEGKVVLWGYRRPGRATVLCWLQMVRRKVPTSRVQVFCKYISSSHSLWENVSIAEFRHVARLATAGGSCSGQPVWVTSKTDSVAAD